MDICWDDSEDCPEELLRLACCMSDAVWELLKYVGNKPELGPMSRGPEPYPSEEERGRPMKELHPYVYGKGPWH